VEQRFVKERSAHIKCYGDLIRRHREEHEVELIRDVMRMAQAGHSEEEILQRFLRLEPALTQELDDTATGYTRDRAEDPKIARLG